MSQNLHFGMEGGYTRVFVRGGWKYVRTLWPASCATKECNY